MAQVNPDNKVECSHSTFFIKANDEKGIYNMILQHGTIHTMAGETIEQGYIVIQNRSLSKWAQETFAY